MSATAAAQARRQPVLAGPAARMLKDRLCGEMLPFWLAKGWDARRGGFQERFFFDGTPDSLTVRLVRTQFRQIGALALAAELGWNEGLRAAFRGLEYMLERAWAPDGAPGFAHVLAPDGAATDLSRHVTDHAAAISALATLARVSEDAQVAGLLRLLMSYVESALHDAQGNIKPEESSEGQRRPVEAYIDLMSALLDAHEALGLPLALERATRIRRRIETAFIEPETGLLPVQLSAAGRAPAAEPPFAVSPGLMARTAAVLRQFERCARLSPAPLATHLIGAALRAATPTTGFLIDMIDSGASVLDSHTRLGAQCALGQAWLAQAGTGVAGAREACEAHIARIEERFLQPPFRGGWIDRLEAQGQPAIDTVPAESLRALVRLAVAANPD